MLKQRLAVVATAMFVSGCGLAVDSGPLVHDTKVIELDRSEMTRVDLKIGAGALRVEGGSPKLMEADFHHNANSPTPSVEYHVSDAIGELNVFQDPGTRTFGNKRNDWTVKLNDTIPVEVAVHVGAGEGRIKLGSLNLRKVELHLGVGEVQVDLRGAPTQSYDATIHGGIGEATVYLPSTVAISATARHGIGDVEVRGLEKRDGLWINPGHESAPVTIRLDVTSGIGSIRLIAE